jgi:hypothetical protein
MTDQANHYKRVGRTHVATHSWVNHGKEEYVRYTPTVTIIRTRLRAFSRFLSAA